MNCSVKSGHRYCAGIQVGFFKRAFANCGVIAEKLKAAGFVDVTVDQLQDAGAYTAMATWPLSSHDASADIDEIVWVKDLGQALAKLSLPSSLD